MCAHGYKLPITHFESIISQSFKKSPSCSTQKQKSHQSVPCNIILSYLKTNFLKKAHILKKVAELSQSLKRTSRAFIRSLLENMEIYYLFDANYLM